MDSEEKIIIPKNKMLLAVGIIVILIIISVFFIIQSLPKETKDDNSDDGVVSDDRLPFVKILLIENNCPECTPIEPLIETIKLFDVNVLEVKTIDADSPEGQDIIKMHGITKLPSLIVNGEFQGTELQNVWSEIGEEKNGVLVLTKAIPPYYSLEEQRLVGEVKFLLIKNSSCIDCMDLSSIASDLREINVFIEEERTIEFDSEEAQFLLENYLIDRVPVILLGGDVNEYDYLTEIWPAVGSVEYDGVFVYREAVPYFDLFSEEVNGLVEVTKLVDETCLDCVDVNYLLEPLNYIGIKASKETTIDISSAEGKALIEKYSITKIPTIIVSSEAEEYTDFFVIWPDVGTQEEDGTFVFRNLEATEQPFVTLE